MGEGGGVKKAIQILRTRGHRERKSPLNERVCDSVDGARSEVSTTFPFLIHPTEVWTLAAGVDIWEAVVQGLGLGVLREGEMGSGHLSLGECEICGGSVKEGFGGGAGGWGWWIRVVDKGAGVGEWKMEGGFVGKGESWMCYGVCELSGHGLKLENRVERRLMGLMHFVRHGSVRTKKIWLVLRWRWIEISSECSCGHYLPQSLGSHPFWSSRRSMVALIRYKL